jgi:hypothetical protein
MGEIGIFLLKLTLRISLAVGALLGFIALLNIVLQTFVIGLNHSIVHDILLLIQIGLPFNLNSVFGWLFVAVNAYIIYRLAMVAFNWITALVGRDS